MNFTDYSNYFELLATKLIDVAHTPDNPKFARFNIEEILAGLAHGLDPETPCLLLESFEGRLSEEGDNVIDTQDAAFLIIQSCELEAFAAQNDIIDRAKQIGFKVIAKLRHDARAGEGLKYFERNSVGYEKVGPIFGNCYGYRFTFSFFNGVSLKLNPADWL
ncbi:MAG: hypothetical protein EOO37_02630 [Cytophagaceae bacterium]|nr:MAG: hypothetical protein EOO37_02630 [Cytophagaceae bacterium]